MRARVLVSIVTHNSDRYLQACLESLKAQTSGDFIISIWDNASSDKTGEIVAGHRAFLSSTHFSKVNVGFCAAHNRLISSAPLDYVLVLNPDVELDARFIEVMVREMDQNSSAGSASGKLWRRVNTTGPKILDTTGIYFTPNQRHFDRGSGEVDLGQYESPEYVFGASGAAAFYRRTMLEDVKCQGEYFDEAFFAYREDADLAWRAQWMGWKCLYVPEARGYHVRRVLPERRSMLSDAVNMHSFKNRFLLRIKNMDVATYARFFLPITVRDAGALIYVVVCERHSLRGIALVIRAFPRSWALRKSLMRRRRASPQEIRSWFSRHPTSKQPFSGKTSRV